MMRSLAASVLLVLMTGSAVSAQVCRSEFARLERAADSLNESRADLAASGSPENSCRIRRGMAIKWDTYLSAYKSTLDCLGRNGSYNPGSVEEYVTNQKYAADFKAHTNKHCN